MCFTVNSLFVAWPSIFLWTRWRRSAVRKWVSWRHGGKKNTDGNKATDPTGTHLWGAGSREIVYVSRDCRLRYVDILLGVFFVNLPTRKSWCIFWDIYWKCVFSYTNNVSKYTSTYLFDIGRCRLLKTWCESCWQVEKNLNGLCGCIVEWDASQGRWKALGNQRIGQG